MYSAASAFDANWYVVGRACTRRSKPLHTTVLPLTTRGATGVSRHVQTGKELFDEQVAKAKQERARELERRKGKLGPFARCKRRSRIWCSVRSAVTMPHLAAVPLFVYPPAATHPVHKLGHTAPKLRVHDAGAGHQARQPHVRSGRAPEARPRSRSAAIVC